MHFHSALGCIVAGHVLELFQVEIGAEFAVEARQQIHVERRGDSCRIVVRVNELFDRLFQVGCEQ